MNWDGYVRDKLKKVRRKNILRIVWWRNNWSAFLPTVSRELFQLHSKASCWKRNVFKQFFLKTFRWFQQLLLNFHEMIFNGIVELNCDCSKNSFIESCTCNLYVYYWFLTGKCPIWVAKSYLFSVIGFIYRHINFVGSKSYNVLSTYMYEYTYWRKLAKVLFDISDFHLYYTVYNCQYLILAIFSVYARYELLHTLIRCSYKLRIWCWLIGNFACIICRCGLILKS